MAVDHLGNYRRALPLGLLFSLAALVAAGAFIYYVAQWNETPSGDRFLYSIGERAGAYQNRTKVEYTYYASVIALLILIVFFNGYHLTKL